MEFASKYIFHSDETEYERVSDEEFEEGMHVSCSDTESDESVYQERRAVKQSLKKKKKRSRTLSGWRQAEMDEKMKNISHSSPTTMDRQSSSSSKCQTKLPGKSQGKNKERWFRRADTNVVSVNFDTLSSPSNMHAGEPVVCPSCRAILSHISKTRFNGDEKTWACEFCEECSVVDVEEEEIAQGEDVTYLLEPSMTTSSSSMSGMDQSLVIFCVDTSGSMCVTTEIDGKIKLRGTSQLQRLQSFNETNEIQLLPSQLGQTVTYVSRLQAMQAAVDHQLEEMAKHHPNRRIALVTFNNEVSVVGDGTQLETTIAGDKLTAKDQLEKEGSEVALPGAIRTSRKVLGEKVFKLEEGGATALGPALIVAVSMAAHHAGSKVIVCTDGKANIGLGKLEEAKDEEAADEFYTQIGNDALSKGVTVSVITIEGTDCKLVHLGKLADKTGGQVNIVDPLKLSEEFNNILADPIIATKVKATFLLYKELCFVDELDPDNEQVMEERHVGNVTKASTITFQFARKKKSGNSNIDAASKDVQVTETHLSGTAEAAGCSNTQVPEASSAKNLSDLPFQLQIEYVDTEGNKALRVITRTMPRTDQRQLAEDNVNLDVLGMHVAKTSSDLALKGQFSESRGVALMNQRLAWRHCHGDKASNQVKGKYKNIYGKIQSMENHIQRKQRSEMEMFGCTRSDSEDSDDNDDALCLSSSPQTRSIDHSRRSKGGIAKKFKRMHSERACEMEDSMANMVYQFRNISRDKIVAPKVRSKDANTSSRTADQSGEGNN